MTKNDLMVILIGGSSNIGKSTIAQSLALKLGWSHLSTDSLARHPGRPWKAERGFIPDHVVEHYSTLSTEELFEDVLRHYQRVWSRIVVPIIGMYTTDLSYDHLIIEGSALWPEFVATLDNDQVSAVWLTSDDELFRKRIYRSSKYEQVSVEEKYLIEQFLARTTLYNKKMLAEIDRLGLNRQDVDDTLSPGDLSNIIFELLMK